MIQPNILIITTDQQHWKMLGCAGNAWVQTPHLDRLAAAGTRLERCYCANPVCSPARFAMYTGRMPSEIGMWANGAPQGAVTDAIKAEGMGHVLSRAGYDCVYTGKEHFPQTNAEELGFRNLTKDERDECASVCADFVSQRRDKPFLLVASLINPHDICYMAIRDFAESEMDHILVEKGETELAMLDWALQRPEGVDEATFFSEYCPPLPDNHDVQLREPEAVESVLLGQRRFRKRAREAYTEERWREHRWAYKRLTEHVDAQIGRMLEALDAGPNAQDTVVIFTSDHGDHDASHKLEHKTVFYEEASRVPLIVRSPAQAKAGVVDSQRLVQNGVDLLPTVCDLAGVNAPVHCQGESFADLLRGESPPAPRESIYLQNQIGEAIVSGALKYVRCFSGKDAEQLHDLVRDPGETRDFALEPEYAAAVEKGRQALESWRARHAVKVPTAEV